MIAGLRGGITCGIRWMLLGLIALFALVVIRIVRLSMWDLTCAIVWFGALLLLGLNAPQETHPGSAIWLWQRSRSEPLYYTSLAARVRNQGIAVSWHPAERSQKLPLVEQIAKPRGCFGTPSMDHTDTVSTFQQPCLDD